MNRTRTAHSIPLKLLADGKPHLIPIYYLLLTSDLAREGIHNSGSYRFADHIYRGRPSGRWGVGALLDQALLAFPSARSFAARYHHTRDSILRYVAAAPRDEPIHILSVPCGIARDMMNAAARLRLDDPKAFALTQWSGLDLDPIPLSLSAEMAKERTLDGFRWVVGDALSEPLPDGQHVIIGTGFGEFLSDADLTGFYTSCWQALRPGGWLVTSATHRHAASDFLLRNFGEIQTHYREGPDLRALLEAAGFTEVRCGDDQIGLQSLAVAVRG